MESAGKPGSVVGNHSSGTAVTGGLKRPTRESLRTRASTAKRWIHSPIWSCSGWGLPCRGVLPAARCALTAPFHPYPASAGRYIFCGTFRGLAPPRCYLAPCPPEPGLSSRSRREAQPSDCLADSGSTIDALSRFRNRGSGFRFATASLALLYRDPVDRPTRKSGNARSDPGRASG